MEKIEALKTFFNSIIEGMLNGEITNLDVNVDYQTKESFHPELGQCIPSHTGWNQVTIVFFNKQTKPRP